VAESLVKGTACIVSGNTAQEEWETREGEKRRSWKVTVEDAAPSLRFATVTVSRAQREKPSPPPADDSWASDKPPF